MSIAKGIVYGCEFERSLDYNVNGDRSIFKNKKIEDDMRLVTSWRGTIGLVEKWRIKRPGATYKKERLART